MTQRRRTDHEGANVTRERGRQRADLATFEREYRLEKLTQRDLMLNLGGVLLFLTAISALLAGRLAERPTTGLQVVAQVLMALTCVGGGVFLLTTARRLDDQRTLQVVTAFVVLGLLFQLALSFYGPGALGAMQVALFAVTVYAGQFLGARSVIAIMALITLLAAIAVDQNYGAAYAPHILSQVILLVIVLCVVAQSIYQMKTERAVALDEADRTAFSDPLTGLPNTRMLRRRAEVLLDSRNERIHRRTGVVLVDLDGFRSANVLRGRREGDRILRAAADAMSRVAAPAHLVARTGSDEFTALVPDANARELEQLAPDYRDAVLEAVDRVAADGVSVDASVGVAISGDGVRSTDDLLGAADRAMYAQKAAHTGGGGQRAHAARTEHPAEPGWDAADAAAPVAGATRWAWLRWSNRPPASRYIALAWLLATVGFAISMRMPDAVEHSSAAIDVIVAVSLVMAVARYMTPPPPTIGWQIAEIVGASTLLAVTVYFSGKSTSPAVVNVLLILIFNGRFLPLRAIVPLSITALAIVLIPATLDQSTPMTTMDAVTIFGGIVLTGVLIFVLYYNRLYIERARSLTATLSTFDPRAGSGNRRAFEARVNEELEELSYGDRDALAVVMIDLGNFKEISAEHGRAAADRLLTEAAAVLSDVSREQDFVARLGGDEFAVVAPGVDAESARTLARRLVAAVGERLTTADEPWRESLRPSAGFALYGMHGRTADELMTAADVALTAAKTTGRDPGRVSSYVVSL
jgi:diguanylate cyclase (GGDEF)-like protein